MKARPRLHRAMTPMLLVLIIAAATGAQDGRQSPGEPQNVDEWLHSSYREGNIDGFSWYRRDTQTPDVSDGASRETLVATVWVNRAEGPYQGALLVFYLDDVFRLGFSDSGVATEGTYEIDEGQVILQADRSYFGSAAHEMLEIEKQYRALPATGGEHRCESSLTIVPGGWRFCAMGRAISER